MAECLWSESGVLHAAPFESEAEFEKAILRVQADLFGDGRIYLDVKKKIGLKGGVRNIPDGYVIDLSGEAPRLYVVENELAAHDPLRHIAVQILQFSLSFESEPIGVKKILLGAIEEQQQVRDRCEAYAASHGFRNLDHMLEWLVLESPFVALVIIDEVPDNLENILAKKFQFGVEVLQIARYRAAGGQEVYRFEPFLADIDSSLTPGAAAQPSRVTTVEIDTVVVPAREGGFKEVFLGENRWYAVRIHGSMRAQIKYVAAYQVAPVSAITHIAPVRSIEPWKDTGKMVLNFAEPAKEIHRIPMPAKGRVRSLQNLRYTSLARIQAAQSLDDIW
jgi:hypothetical protein